MCGIMDRKVPWIKFSLFLHVLIWFAVNMFVWNYNIYFLSVWIAWSRAIWNLSPCCRALVHREKRSTNVNLHAIKGIFSSLLHAGWIFIALSLMAIVFGFLQAAVLDQGLEADLVSTIQRYLEDLIASGLRQRIVSLIKVWPFPSIYLYEWFLVVPSHVVELSCAYVFCCLMFFWVS